MEENLKRNFNLISLQHGALNFAAISLDDRWPLNGFKKWHISFDVYFLFYLLLSSYPKKD